jgi:hypothetical protein
MYAQPARWPGHNHQPRIRFDGSDLNSASLTTAIRSAANFNAAVVHSLNQGQMHTPAQRGAADDIADRMMDNAETPEASDVVA